MQAPTVSITTMRKPAARVNQGRPDLGHELTRSGRISEITVIEDRVDEPQI